MSSETKLSSNARRGGGDSENMIDGPVSSVWFTRVSGIGEDENRFPEGARLNMGRVREEVDCPARPAVVTVSVEFPALSGRRALVICSATSSCEFWLPKNEVLPGDRFSGVSVVVLMAGVAAPVRGVVDPSSLSLTYGSCSSSSVLLESSLSSDW